MIVTIEMVVLYTCTINSCSCGRFYCCAQPKMNYTKEHRIALLEAYLTNTSCQYCGQQCKQKFPDVSVSGKQTVYDLICRFR